MSERWDIETITARAARDWADQFHFGRGAGDDSEAYEADYARAKAKIAEALAEHDRQVAERAWDEGWADRHGLPENRVLLTRDGRARNPHRAAKGEQGNG